MLFLREDDALRLAVAMGEFERGEISVFDFEQPGHSSGIIWRGLRRAAISRS
jgi:hypothetical protein